MPDDNATDRAPSGAARNPETREDRLAAKLRENLRRRKMQARAQQSAAENDLELKVGQEDAQSESDALSKPAV